MRSSRTKLLVLALAALSLASCGKPKAKGGAEDPAVAASNAWLVKNAKDPLVKTTPSGLQYKILRSGPVDGPRPRLGDEVKVNYEGSLIDGTVFDSSYERGTPIDFTVGTVVPGWNEALQLMRPGDVWYLYLSPQLGYGPEGKGPIPPNAVMEFKVELLGVLPHSGKG